MFCLLGDAGFLNLKLKLSLLGRKVMSEKIVKQQKNNEVKKTTGNNF